MNQIEKGQDAEAQMLRVSPAQKPGAIAPSIPEHQLVCPIATGAYGEVWLGLNPVGTPRAVKIVRRDQHTTTESFEREFKGLQNFEPISRSHEGLVDILTLGLLPDETGFYYVMELADAINLSSSDSAVSTNCVGILADHRATSPISKLRISTGRTRQSPMRGRKPAASP